MNRNISDDAHIFIQDITNAWSAFGVMGPNGRDLLEKVLSIDLSNEAFPFGTHQEVKISFVIDRATCVTFCG